MWGNPIALRKAKIVYNFGLSECNRVNSSIPSSNLRASSTLSFLEPRPYLLMGVFEQLHYLGLRAQLLTCAFEHTSLFRASYLEH